MTDNTLKLECNLCKTTYSIPPCNHVQYLGDGRVIISEVAWAKLIDRGAGTGAKDAHVEDALITVIDLLIRKLLGA